MKVHFKTQYVIFCKGGLIAQTQFKNGSNFWLNTGAKFCGNLAKICWRVGTDFNQSYGNRHLSIDGQEPSGIDRHLIGSTFLNPNRGEFCDRAKDFF
jgi:hypothetical protein